MAFLATAELMIKICLDANAFQDNWMASGEAFTFLAEFIKSGLSELCIPEGIHPDD